MLGADGGSKTKKRLACAGLTHIVFKLKFIKMETVGICVCYFLPTSNRQEKNNSANLLLGAVKLQLWTYTN